jgi:hypothetical protein
VLWAAQNIHGGASSRQGVSKPKNFTAKLAGPHSLNSVGASSDERQPDNAAAVAMTTIIMQGFIALAFQTRPKSARHPCSPLLPETTASDARNTNCGIVTATITELWMIAFRIERAEWLSALTVEVGSKGMPCDVHGDPVGGAAARGN